MMLSGEVELLSLIAPYARACARTHTHTAEYFHSYFLHLMSLVGLVAYYYK